jgi:signal peptidase I
VSDDLYIGPTALAPAPKDPNKLAGLLARWLVLPLTVSLVVILLVFYILFSSAVVSGPSMKPTLLNSDYLLVTHGDRSPKRGEIIVTSVVEGTRPIELVKRIIALPGDTVEIRGDVAYVNGVAEPARGQIVDPQFAVDRPALVVPAGSIYVMGDNRPVSEDSRDLGPVPISGIRGRAVFLFAPIYRVRPV